MAVNPSLSKPANTAILFTIVGMALILIVFSVISMFARRRRNLVKQLGPRAEKKYEKNQALVDELVDENKF